MSAVDRMLTKPSTELGNTGLIFRDADTLRDPDDDTLYRIKGYDAPEIEAFNETRGYKTGTAGGRVATDTVVGLANDLGFTNVIKLDEMDATGSRQMVDLQNEKGESFTSKLIESGVFAPTGYTADEDQLAATLASQARAENQLAGEVQDDDWTLAKAAVMQAVSDETLHERDIRQTAFNEEELAKLKAEARYFGHKPSDVLNLSNVAVRDSGRDLENWSNNPFADSFDQSLSTAMEGLYGFLDMTGVPIVSEFGEANAKRVRSQIESMPELAMSYNDVEGFFGKRGAFTYVTNNVAASLPYMGITAASIVATPLIAPAAAGTLATGATIAGATASLPTFALGVGTTAAATTALGLTALSPAAIYAGNIWNEQEGDNKNAAVAIGAGITQAVLDRVGLKALVSGSARFLPKNQITDPTARKELINRLVNEKGFSKKAATKKVMDATKEELIGLAKDGAAFAKQQLGARNLGRSILKRVRTGSGVEAFTEGMQEAIGYTAANTANNFQTWDANQFNERVINGVIAGGTIGGALSVPGGVFDNRAWKDLAFRKGPSTSRNRSTAAQFADKDKGNNRGRQVNIQEYNQKTTGQLNAREKAGAGEKYFLPTTKERIADNKENKTNRTLTETGVHLVRSIPGLFRKMSNTMFDNELQVASDEARWLGESIGANNQRSTSGATYENYKHHLLAIYKGVIPTFTDILKSFGHKNPNALINNPRKEFSEKFYAAYRAARANADKAKRADIDWDQDLKGTPMEGDVAAMKTLVTQLQQLSDKLYNDQLARNPDLGYEKDYLLKYKSFNKEAIEADRHGFAKKLTEVYDMSEAKAIEITNNIINTDGLSSFEDAGLVGYEAAGRPGAHKKRKLGLSAKEEFNDFMQNDLFANISNASKSAARYIALEDYFGADGKKLDYKLQKIEDELVQKSNWSREAAKKRVDKLAQDMQDYLEIESGNYKRIENDTIRAIQDNFLFYSAIISLPLSTVSNFVELPMQARGLTAKQIAGKDNSSLKSLGENLGQSFWFGFTQEGRREATSGAAKRFKGYGTAQELGFFEWEVGAATTTGVLQMDNWKRKILDQYFRVNMLQSWTNTMRSARAGIAGDYIINHLETLRHVTDPAKETVEQHQAREALRNLGLDPEYLLDLANRHELDALDGRQLAELDLMLRDGMFNFVNEAIALPQAGNRPKIFQDPRFALFTQFQGFISTFTANHIPRLWNEYIRRGTPSMRFHAFSLVATMIMMGFASQALKDLLKFGTLDNPHLDEVDYIRRGVAASGWLGTGERVLDFAFPIYESRYNNPVDWVIGTAAGESAAISKGARVFSYGLKEFDQEDPTTWSDWARISPFGQSLYTLLPKGADVVVEQFEQVEGGEYVPK